MIYDILEDLLPFFDDNSDKISNTDYKFIKKFIASIYPYTMKILMNAKNYAVN